MKKYVICIAFVLTILPIAAQQITEHWIDVDKGRLYCQTIGKGEPLLFIHGGPGLNQSYLIPAFETLAKKYMLIFYDQRSSGKSALSVKATMNFETFADDIDSIRKYFVLEKINIISHSWGSLVAINYAAVYPKNINTLILLNPVPANTSFTNQMNTLSIQRTSSFDSLERARIIQTEDFKSGKSNAILQLMKLSFKLNFCDTSSLGKLKLELPENYAAAALSYEGWMKDMKNYDVSPQLKRIQCPVFILYGACDIIPVEAAVQIQNLISNSDIKIYADAGHFCFIEQNRRSIKDIQRFLQSVSKR
ncbi:MAG: alpha/beta fold hydrolase [Chitinophagales bacterium]|nr:alpha/beta fold hydrolase [Chitinophagales bacterium]MBP9703237.1 alpha/beta fold hydrolase [Chitinophagales bacterium]